MKSSIWITFFCTFLAASISWCADRPLHNWIIEPGIRVGPVMAKSSEAELLKQLGKSMVKQSQIDVGEGEELPGTLLFPDDPEKTLQILWKDQEARRYPAQIIIKGDHSVWHTTEGISLGTTLVEIEKLNGGRVHITGFGWDYSGTIIDAANGKLKFLGTNEGAADIKGRTLLVRLDPSEADIKKISSDEFHTVLGDGILRFDNAVIQKLNPRVYEIVVVFP
jgi:hypothetical protein